jgi:hypothetical protein
VRHGGAQDVLPAEYREHGDDGRGGVTAGRRQRGTETMNKTSDNALRPSP